MTKTNRKEIIVKAGMDAQDFLSLTLLEGLKAGTELKITIEEPEDELDEFARELEEESDIEIGKRRRWIMAQMFKMLSFESVSWGGAVYRGYNDYIKRYMHFDYMLKFMAEECERIENHIRKGADEKEEKLFFDNAVVAQVMRDYIEALKKHVGTLKVHMCKGKVPYVHINNTYGNIFVEDLEEKLYKPFEDIAFSVQHKSYASYYLRKLTTSQLIRKFMKLMVAIPYSTEQKSKTFIDAFKGNGAYWTLHNMINFHGVRINGMNKKDSWLWVQAKADEFHNEKYSIYGDICCDAWYKLFGIMKELITQNGLDVKYALGRLWE